jgi:hypothetical protein
MLSTERKRENGSPQRSNIKFKTIRNECLPYLRQKPQPSLGFSKFEKK